MKKFSYRTIWVGILFFIGLFACTHIETEEVQKRVTESLSGELATPSDLDPSGTNQFSFAVLGDPHLGGFIGGLLDNAIAKMQEAGDQFAIVVGDLADNGRVGEYQTLKGLFSQANIPFRAAIGNHDIYFGGWKNYKSEIGTSIYSMDADNVHFTFLDSANGVWGKRQIDWLINDLETTTQPIKVIVTHTSPWTGRFGSIFRMSSEEEVAMVKHIANKYNVDLIFSGHYHGFAQQKVGNTTIVTTGGVNKFTEIGHKKHFVRVHINGNNWSLEKVDL